MQSSHEHAAPVLTARLDECLALYLDVCTPLDILIQHVVHVGVTQYLSVASFVIAVSFHA